VKFVKRGPPGFAPMYAAEAEGLRALRAAGVRAPEPYAHGVHGAEAFIEMERLKLGGPADWPALARMLAGLHRNIGQHFGWENDNWIGLSPQHNGWSDDWGEFWRERRLEPQLAVARSNGFSIDCGPLLQQLPVFFDDHRPQASLLHGDLWSGNIGFTHEGPVIFDPAVYYGDREADLAMTELFGGFPREFYAVYAQTWPLDPGYSTRKDLYNLYHVLNHANLFGGSYASQAARMVTRLLAQTGS
jgi:protein-ribulosamine 3-kinase